MSSKPKEKTFIVHQNGGLKNRCAAIARWRVGARNSDEAISMIRNMQDSKFKHAKLSIYYEVQRGKKLPHGMIIDESMRGQMYK